MPRDDFYTPTDTDALRMENELLAFEVRFLKTRLAETEQLENRLEEAEDSIARLESRLQEARRAKQDLVLLLKQLANSRLGWFFGLKQGFRVLEQRYLGPDA